MKGTWGALGLGLALLLASWAWLHGLNAENRAVGQAVTALVDFVRAESELQRDVLSARAGILRNYDPIVGDVDEMRAAVDRLGAAFADEASMLAATVTGAEAVAEHFKSANALLQNSLAYFATLSERLETSDPEIVRGVNGLSAAVLNLTLDTSPAAVTRVDAAIDRIPADPDLQPTLDALVSHAVQLRTLLPDTDADVDALAALASNDRVGRVRAAILARQDLLARRADTARWLLYGLALVLAGLLVVVGARLRGRVRALRHRAAIEHVVAKISMRFLSTPPWKMDAHLSLALEELAAAFGASRAYLVLPGAPLRTIVALREGPALAPGWAERLVAHMETAGKGDGSIVHIENQPRCGDVASGMRTWLCVSRVEAGEVRAVLGLDGRRARAFREFDSTRLLTLAFNALTGAIAKRTLEEERERLEAHLSQARRMETIGTFASGIAHNFNNIIGAVLGHAEMAATSAPQDGRLAGHIQAIQIAGERASDLVDQVLTFGRRREGAVTLVDLDELVAEAALMMQSMLPLGVRLVVRERSGLTVASAEPGELGQVVLNLLRNAAQAIDGAGTISVAVEAREAVRQTVGDDSLEPGRYLVIAVEDDGRGMDPVTLRSVFEPFFTTREAGNGLGLATAREIVRNHHGAIGVTSTPGAGTRFEVFLPTMREGSPTVARRGYGEAVLLLDGDDDRRLRLEDAIAALGYEPVGFAEVASAVAACRAAPDRFDAALLCDPGSPACVAVHCAAPHLGAVLATGAAPSFGAEFLARSEIAAVVPLPPTFAQLAEALELALAWRRGCPPGSQRGGKSERQARSSCRAIVSRASVSRASARGDPCGDHPPA